MKCSNRILQLLGFVVILLCLRSLFNQMSVMQYLQTKPIREPSYPQLKREHTGHVDKPLIPNVVHYIVDYEDHAMGFRFYFSVKSVLKYIQPLRIIFHCVVEPLDTMWWKAAKRSSRGKLEFKLINNTDVINSTTLKFKSPSHRDSFRRELVVQEGGIFLESDVLALKSFDSLRMYPVVLARPSLPISGNVIISERNSTFARQGLVANITYSFKPKFEFVNLTNAVSAKSRSQQNSVITVSSSHAAMPTLYYCQEGEYYIRISPQQSMGKVLNRGNAIRKVAENILFSTQTDNNQIPGNFHFIWKTRKSRDLSFLEYQSLKSLSMFGNPVKIYVHFTTEPIGVRWNDIMSIKHFEAVYHPGLDNKVTDILYDTLTKQGGVLVKFGVLFISPCDPIRATSIVKSHHNSSITDSLLMVPANSEKMLLMRNEYNNTNQQHTGCILLEDECVMRFDSIKEAEDMRACRQWKDRIWITIHDVNNVITNATLIDSMNSTVGEVLRFVMYGVSAVIKPSLFKVPNYVHYVWFGKNKTLEFFHFLSMVSAYLVQKPDKIYIHYETLPVGTFWERLRKTVPNIELVHTRPNASLGGIKASWVQHQADLTRIQVLSKYGGIYVDTDIYFVNSVDPLRVYDFAMSRAFAKFMANSFFLSTRGNNFLKLYEEGYMRYNSKSWNYNSLFYPYLLWLKNRNSVQFIPQRKTYQPDRAGLYFKDKQFYWKDRYIIHLYFRGEIPRHVTFEEMINLIYSDKFYNTTFGEASRRIYEMYQERVSIIEAGAF